MTTQDTAVTTMIFRKFRGDDDVIALFHLIPAMDRCMSYQHIGQHGDADYSQVMAVTRPATVAEYAPLLTELETIGYRVKVRVRRP